MDAPTEPIVEPTVTCNDEPTRETDPVRLEKFIEILNTAFEKDPAAMHALICNRVPCNSTLADDPYVLAERGTYSDTVGVLGILNAACLALLGDVVAVKFSEPDDTGRRTVTGFCRYTGTSLRDAGRML